MSCVYIVLWQKCCYTLYVCAPTRISVHKYTIFVHDINCNTSNLLDIHNFFFPIVVWLLLIAVSVNKTAQRFTRNIEFDSMIIFNNNS